MQIDYSISERESGFHYFYSNFSFGAKHIAAACTTQRNVDLIERIKHFALGVLEMIPLIGHIVAIIDRHVHHIPKRILVLNQNTPYERGLAHGKQYRSEIRSIYRSILDPKSGWIKTRLPTLKELTLFSKPIYSKRLKRSQPRPRQELIDCLLNFKKTMKQRVCGFGGFEFCPYTRYDLDSPQFKSEDLPRLSKLPYSLSAILHMAMESTCKKLGVSLKDHDLMNGGYQYREQNESFWYYYSGSLEKDQKKLFYDALCEKIACLLNDYGLDDVRVDFSFELRNSFFEEDEQLITMKVKGVRLDQSTVEKLPKKQSVQDLNLDDWCEVVKNQLSPEERCEMEGIAAGAGVPFDWVVKVNTFSDLYPGQGACSALASAGDNTCGVTNHFLSMGESENCHRYKHLKSLPGHEFQQKPMNAHKRAMKKVGVSVTMQSILFDTNKRTIHLSTSRGDASKKSFSVFSKLFGNQSTSGSSSDKRVVMSRNFDWDWPLGPDTIVLVRDGVASITWPGFIGSVSGMNRHGVSLAVCASGGAFDSQGSSNPLFLQKMLTQVKSVKEALDFLEQVKPASSMNLMLAGPNGYARVELDPERVEKGPAVVVEN